MEYFVVGFLIGHFFRIMFLFSVEVHRLQPDELGLNSLQELQVLMRKGIK